MEVGGEYAEMGCQMVHCSRWRPSANLLVFSPISCSCHHHHQRDMERPGRCFPRPTEIYSCSVFVAFSASFLQQQASVYFLSSRNLLNFLINLSPHPYPTTSFFNVIGLFFFIFHTLISVRFQEGREMNICAQAAI